MNKLVALLHCQQRCHGKFYPETPAYSVALKVFGMPLVVLNF